MTQPTSQSSLRKQLTALSTGSTTAFRTLLLLVTGVCNGTVAVWLAITPPATGYEGSIYAAYPTTLWAVFLLGLSAAILLVLRSAVVGDRSWIYGLAFICSLYVLFHLLPLFRGWAMYGRGSADALAHLGTAKQILETGAIPAHDWYPSVHVLIAGLTAFGLPLQASSSVLSAIFTPLYIVSMYLLGRSILGGRKAGLAVLVWSVPLVFREYHHSLHPAIFSFLLLPVFAALLVGAYNSDRRRSHVAFLAVLGLTLLFFHPITTLYLIGMLMVSLVARILYSRLTDHELQYSLEPLFAFGLAAGWVAWFFQFTQIQVFAGRVLSSNSDSGSGGETDGTEPVASSLLGRLQDVGGIEQLVTGFITNYGTQFVVSALAGVAVLGAIGWYLSTRELRGEDTWLTFQFGAGVGLTFVGIFFYIVASNPIRNARYMLLFATLLAGLLLYRSLTDRLSWSPGTGKAVQVVLVVLLLSTAGLSVMTSYNDNYHLTHAEDRGTDWYFDYRSDEAVGAAADVSYKMREYSVGGDFGTSKFREFGSESATLDKRFGYADHESVGTAVDGYETYIATKPYDTTVPKFLDPSVREKHTAYYEEDLQRLGTDRGADRIYANGGYTVWYVDPEE
ncbi:MAG: hypothetical protein U9O06_11135 [Euryarchaeota archaeon]|nr:hypothetical protein [Euryarchaeota archaeon]